MAFANAIELTWMACATDRTHMDGMRNRTHMDGICNRTHMDGIGANVCACMCALFGCGHACMGHNRPC